MTIRAEAGLRGALELQKHGFAPDVIVAHPAWGDALFLKDVWPDARLGVYCEHFMHPLGEPPFDPEFTEKDSSVAIRAFDKIKSIPQHLLFDVANAGLSPTHFQKSTFPVGFQQRISVVHDGIDVERAMPRQGAMIRFGNGKELTAADEVVTYIARHLEPARGFNIFMRALPELLRARPNAHFVIVGGDNGSYGNPPPGGGNWREFFLREVGDRLDTTRVHFVGQLNYSVFLELLAVARLRIYLTHPTVLSWSMMESMAAGLPILGSDTAPVSELITDGVTGRLFPYHDGEAMVRIACEMLEDEEQRRAIAANARAHIVENYALKTVCLPQQFDWIDRLAAEEPRPPLMERY
jgi:glycosyltransferase involved in cell wall biosynthesis